MKRYIAFDFLRGIAIIGVLGFHLMAVLYDYEAALDANPPIAFYILVIVLYWVGQFDILFLILSGTVNTISIDKQWEKLIAQNPSDEEKKRAADKIMKSQVIRGLFIYAMSYVSEWIMNGLLLNVIIQEPDAWTDSIGAFYYTNILQAIALGTILSGVIYAKLLQSGKDQAAKIRQMFIWVLIIFLVTPFMVLLSHTFPLFHEGWKNRSFGLNVIYFFLNPILRRGNPFFPYAATSIIGAMIGCKISGGKTTKEYLNRVIYTALLLFGIGFFLFIFKVIDLADTLNLENNTMPLFFLNSIIDIGEILMVTGGSLLAMMILLYLIDIRGKGTSFAKYTVPIRRFGLISLTLFATQWILAVLLIIYHNIDNLISGTTIAFRDSPYFNGGWTGWQTWGWFLLSIFIYHCLLWLWGKVNFTGSFEWITVKLLSRNRKDAGERLDLNTSLYAVESPVLEGQEFYGRGTQVAFWMIFFILGVIYTAIDLL
jgi:hypothetical protein